MDLTLSAPAGPQRVLALESLLRTLRDIGYDVTVRVSGQPHHATYFAPGTKKGEATIVVYSLAGGANVR